MKSNLYSEIVKHGIPFRSRYADLYFEWNEKARAILEKFPREKEQLTLFVDHFSHKTWADVPRAYTPFWEEQIKRNQLKWSNEDLTRD